MPVASKESFRKKEIDIAAFAKALAHPARVAILTTLAQKQECLCGDLVLDLPLSQSTVSQHLKALKEMGLIRGVIDGPRSRYCIDWNVFEKHLQVFGDWSQKMRDLRTDLCC